MGVALVDSSTFVGFLDADDLLHRAADAAVGATAIEPVLAVSGVTMAEVLTDAMRPERHPARAARRLAEKVCA